MKCYVPVEEQAWNTRFGWECFDNVIEVIRPEESRWIYLPDMLNKEKKIEKFVKQNFETDNFIAKGCYYKKYIPLVVPDNLKKSNKLYVRTTFIEYGDYGDDVAGAVWVLRDNKLYNEEMMKLLEKAKKIVTEAEDVGITLNFNFNINNDAPHSYKDIVQNKEEIENVKLTVKNLEKEYMTKKAEKSVSNIDAFIDSKEEINGMNIIVAITENYEVPVLKQVVDAISNKVSNSFVLLANVGSNNANFICKSTISNDNINCGSIIKDLAIKCSGNGGGNKNYAQGGGTKTDDIPMLLAEIKEKVKNS